MSLQENFKNIQRKIENACNRSKRELNDIKLIAVSKTKSVEAIREAYSLGLRDFGENYVQEFLEKKDSLSDLSEIRWHFIGSIQRNKIKSLMQAQPLIHSVDRVELLDKLVQEVKDSLKISIFLQINLEAEKSKSGFLIDELKNLYIKIKNEEKYEKINVLGLMSIPAPQNSPEEQRKVFRNIFNLAQELKIPNAQLSMGMSEDFEVAIEEGANFIRIGRALFGERD